MESRDIPSRHKPVLTESRLCSDLFPILTLPPVLSELYETCPNEKKEELLALMKNLISLLQVSEF